jgi:tetratricopeptide (TPR) repeat protein
MQGALDDPTIVIPPLVRAVGLIRLGTSFANAGLIAEESDYYDRSARAYHSAMDLIAGLDEPLTRARAYWGLAIALAGQGVKLRSTDFLKQSEQASEEALKEIRADKYPVDWATIVHNRANAKLERGRLENGVDALVSAIEDYEAAMSVRTKDRFTLGYIKSMGNMAIAKRIMAQRLSDAQLALNAQTNIEDAISAIASGEEYWLHYYSKERDEVMELIKSLDR